MTRVAAHKRKILVITTFLVALVGLSGLEQLFQPRLNATQVAGSQLTQSASANQAVLKAAVTKAAAVKANAASPKAATTSLTLSVKSARQSTIGGGPTKGQAITKYNWLINADNTGDPGQVSSPLVNYNQTCVVGHPAAADCPTGNDGSLARNADVCHPYTAANPTGNPGFNDPAKALGMACQWPSIHRSDSPPVVSEGTEADWNTTTPLPALDPTTGRGLPPGKYLVSVTANGYTLGGIHFTSPMTAPGVVEVGLNPYPIPLGNMVLKAFKDMSPTDGQWDVSKPGLPGFQPQIQDPDGVVSVDYFGNPLCTRYQKNGAGKTILDADGRPIRIPSTGNCVTDANGDVTIPNLAPNRYSIRMLQPNGQDWVQTTTLEGNHDYDVWIMPNDTGLDTEMVVGGESTPFVNIGFVKPTPMALHGNGSITGRVAGAAAYMPGQGALPGLGLATGTSGIKLLDKPIAHPWISLADMNNSDQVFYAAETNPDGSFNVNGLPPGDYQITAWDQPQNYELDAFQFSVTNDGQVIDVGVVPVLGWWAHVFGHVYLDKNGNGRQDPGEPGIPKLTVQNLNRTNNAYQGGINTADTDFSGYYDMKQAYSLGQFTVNQAFFTRYKTTGITYQACNDPQEHTVITGLVDVSFLPIIGQCGRLDWGVKPYDAPAGDNGGIVATAQYDDVRLHFSTRQASSLGHQVGIAGFDFQLWQPATKADGSIIKCDGTETLAASVPDSSVPGTVISPPATPGVYCVSGDDGSTATTTGTPLQNYQSEKWGQPTDCTPRDANGNPLVTQQDAVPIPTATYHPQCVESSITGMQFGLGIDDPALHGPQTVEGNYAMGYPGDPKGVGDWVVKAASPGDTVLPQVNGQDRPLFTTTTENDVNNYGVGQYIPQDADTSAVSWPPKPGTAYQMAQAAPGGYPENPGTYGPNPDPICAGSAFVVNVTNPNFMQAGGSPFQGHTRNLCDAKLLHAQAGASIAPNFHFHTANDVPLPTKFSGPIVDDVSISSDRRSTMLSDVQGLSNSPIGIYDWSGRLLAETNSDPNGQFEVIMPSSDTVNCPNPSNGCPMVYRFVGNDPGQFGAPNRNYNPSYRTIAANFEAWPGMFAPADMAPTKAITSFAGQGVQFTAGPPPCTVAAADPQIFAVDQPYNKGTASRTLTIQGQGFGNTKGTVRLVGPDTYTLSSAAATTWSDTQITVPVNGQNINGNPYQLVITTAGGKTPTNSLTFHELKGSYNPRLLEVGPGKPYTVIQAALEAAAAPPNRNQPNALVVVYPNATDPNAPAFTPLGAYYENIIIHSPVKVQGVGPGGLRADGSAVFGTTIDGRYFWQTTMPETAANVSGGASEPYMLAWNNLANSLNFDGNQNIAGGEVVYVLGRNGQYKTSYKPAIDGFTITGGDSRDYPGNINELKGAGAGLPTAVAPGIVEAQGGGIFLNAYADNFQVTNNVVQGNAGSYGGGIRVGTPYVPASTNHNHNVVIANNQLIANGGTNLAGGIGLFIGSDNYRIHDNVLCGNHSSEYGGGVSHFGLSAGGRIDHNKLFLNESVDEGGGIMVAGELQLNRTLSPGSGTIAIDHNYIGANLAGDDGGGIRFLMAGKSPIDVSNNMLTNNISAHEGGGIAIDDTPALRIVNNTIAKNITTATAVTSNGQPAPAGISTTQNSTVLQATLPVGAPTFSNPLLFNDIFYDNRAGSWTANGVVGIGQALDASPINYWDIGAAGTGGNLSPTFSVLGSTQGYNNSPTNHVQLQTSPTANFPQFVAPYDIHVTINPFRTYFKFRPSAIVSVDLPTNVLGDYHLKNVAGPANGTGTSNAVAGVTPPRDDIDSRARTNPYEIGAAELPGGGVGNVAQGNALVGAAPGPLTTAATSGGETPANGGAPVGVNANATATGAGALGSSGSAPTTAPMTSGNGTGKAINQTAGTILSLILNSPVTLPIAGLLVVLALLAGFIIYRRRRKGISR